MVIPCLCLFVALSSLFSELVGAKPLHLLAQTALPLKSLTGAFIAAQTRTFLSPFFTGKEHSSQDGAKLLISVKKI